MNRYANGIARTTLRRLLACAFFALATSAHAQTPADTAGRKALDLFNAKQYAAAKDAATAGAASGSAASMYVLGEIYSSGSGVAQNYAEAESWLQKAADAGYAPAMNSAGNSYETGHGVEQNFALAAAWYRRAAEKGYGLGMNSLGHMFEIGGGVPKDYAQAFQWYFKGAEAGASAMPGPDGVYRGGGGVSQPKLLRKFEPEYTETARNAKLEGTVTLQFVVDANGKGVNFKVIKSLGLGLDEKAIEAVKKWKFDPGRKDGKPVSVQAAVDVNFRLL